MAVKQPKLNVKQDLFCTLYVLDRECFGNATKSYASAYEVEPNESCSSNASRLLRNDKVLKRIDQLLDDNFKAEIIDRELMRLILQNEDLGVKVSAIREYNKIKGRINEKVDSVITVRWATPEDLKKS